MSSESAIPELKQILGAMIFGSDHPLSVKEMRRCLIEVATSEGGALAAFAGVKETDISAALEALKIEVDKIGGGFSLSEVAGGMRFHSDPACGKWLKHLLDTGRPSRLSSPALETLAIIAYRQPVTRNEIEGVRGVNVDHIMRMLMEMQLVRIVGRSELPGKPFQYGTTQAFLEHFGLRNLDELRGMDPMLLAARERDFKKKPAQAVTKEEIPEELEGPEGGDTEAAQASDETESAIPEATKEENP
jgi:segregation and condensation protein B